MNGVKVTILVRFIFTIFIYFLIFFLLNLNNNSIPLFWGKRNVCMLKRMLIRFLFFVHIIIYKVNLFYMSWNYIDFVDLMNLVSE